MSDMAAELARLRQKVTAAQQQLARAEHQRDTAQAAAEASAQALKEEFGVATVAEARALEVKLQADLEAETVRVRGLLEQAGEPGG